MRGCTHFVGFRGEEYWSAVRIWGRPHVIHRRWDRRARREIGDEDVVVFAAGDDTQEPPAWNADDLDERLYSSLLGLPWVNDKV